METPISDREFAQFQRLMQEAAGIQLSDAKKILVSCRLANRLRVRNLASFGDYFRLITSGDESELQVAVDLLTTNETYFFREPKHFDFLRGLLGARQQPDRPFRVWSAASSSGEEAYSIAMVLADRLGKRPWEVFASDLSTRVLERARVGHYPMERAVHLPPEYLRRFCLKGNGPQEGTLLVADEIRSRVRFEQVNLVQAMPAIGLFDVIFLRNVMIYFDNDTKRLVVDGLFDALVPGGHLLIGHSETLNGITDRLDTVAPAIYRKA